MPNIKDLHIGVSALTNKVYIGQINEEKGCFVGEKKDITGEFHNALVMLYGDYEVVITDKQKYYLLSMEEISKEVAEKIKRDIKKEANVDA